MKGNKQATNFAYLKTLVSIDDVKGGGGGGRKITKNSHYVSAMVTPFNKSTLICNKSWLTR